MSEEELRQYLIDEIDLQKEFLNQHEVGFIREDEEERLSALETALNLIDKQKKEIKQKDIMNEALKNAIGNILQGKKLCKEIEGGTTIRINLIEEKNKIIEQLANGIRVLGTNPDITTAEIIKGFTENPISEEYMKKFKSGYISKDEVLKALGYEENDEEYKRIYNKDELILSLIQTINKECDRLEDIEDRKTMVEVNNIENMRDKYWQEKIRNLLPKINGSISHFKSENDNHIVKRIKRMLEDLLKEDQNGR